LRDRLCRAGPRRDSGRGERCLLSWHPYPHQTHENLHVSQLQKFSLYLKLDSGYIFIRIPHSLLLELPSCYPAQESQFVLDSPLWGYQQGSSVRDRDSLPRTHWGYSAYSTRHPAPAPVPASPSAPLPPRNILPPPPPPLPRWSGFGSSRQRVSRPTRELRNGAWLPGILLLLLLILSLTRRLSPSSMNNSNDGKPSDRWPKGKPFQCQWRPDESQESSHAQKLRSL
jgi:hypothetical protein